MFVNHCLPSDVADRLRYRKRYWFNGPPNIDLKGDEHTFGKLLFDFKDEVVSFDIWISDREAILNASHLAIASFHDPEAIERISWNYPSLISSTGK